MIDEEKLKVMLSDSPPPPWVDSEYDEEIGEMLREHVHMLLITHATDLRLNNVEQGEVVMLLMMKAATWGWDAAMNIGPMAQRFASPAAAEAKQARKAERYAEIRAAFDAAAAAGQEPDINELASRFSVSRPTVYRALRAVQ